MLFGDFFAWYWNMCKELFRKKRGREEWSLHSCCQRHCFCLLQEQCHWRRLAVPEIPHSWISGCWLTPSRLQRNTGVLDIETKVFIWGSRFSLPVWGPWTWLSVQWRAPAACGAQGEVLMATCVARQMDDCVLFLPPCSQGSWLHL